MRLLTLLCMLPVIAYAQPSGRPAFGAYGAVSLNSSSATFEQLEGYLNCNSLFREGSGIGPAAGLFYEHPVVDKLAVMVRGSFRQANTSLVSSEFTAIGVSGVVTDARIDHTLDASIAVLGIEPSLKFTVFSGLSVTAGIEAGYVLQHTFEQRETLEEPADVGAFATGTRTRNEQSGEIPNANKFIMSVISSVSYALPLNENNTLQLVPELSYRFAQTPVATDVDWSISSFSAGVGIRFVIPEPTVVVQPELEPPIVIPPVAAVPEPVFDAQPPILLATVKAVGVDEKGVESPVVHVRIEEVASTRVVPLLPYLFFEPTESQLPPRYRNAPQAEDALAMHQGMLHELARRMKSAPKAKLSITGMTLNNKNATVSDATAIARAKAVATYLNEALGIDRSRLQVASSPMQASTTPSTIDEDGIAEVNRVELYSEDASILAPITLSDTLRIASPPELRFYMGAESSDPIERWQIAISQNGMGLKVLKGQGTPPESVSWVVADDQQSIPQVPGVVDIELEIATKSEIKAARTQVSVEQLTMRRKQATYAADKEVEEFNIVLFDIGSSELNAAQRRIIETDIKPRIRPNSIVSIVGHTDRMGDATANAALSLSRALNTARVLGVPSANVRGLGEESLKFNNDTPEARCLSRTVEIRIETPIETP